ncbi:MAG: hypothetical protein R3E72_10950 [Steroidobacteraceae bacterium]
MQRLKRATSSARVGVLPKSRRRTLYVISMGTWVTGAVWLIYHYFVTSVDQFGFENVHPYQHGWLVAHGVFAVAAAWMFGVLWPNHVLRGWKAKVRRTSGGWLFGVVTWLMLTGVALYYIGSTEWRAWTSLAHWIVGLATLLPFLIHWYTRSRIDMP